MAYGRDPAKNNALVSKFSTAAEAIRDGVNPEELYHAILANSKEGTMLYAEEYGKDGKSHITCWTNMKDYGEIENFARYVNDHGIPSVRGKKLYTAAELNKSIIKKILRQEGYYSIDSLKSRLSIPDQLWDKEMFRNNGDKHEFLIDTFCMSIEDINKGIDTFNKLQKFSSNITEPMLLREITDRLGMTYEDGRLALKLFRSSLERFYKSKTPRLGGKVKVRTALLKKIFGKELEDKWINVIAAEDYDVEEIGEYREKIVKISKSQIGASKKKIIMSRYLRANVFSPTRMLEFPKSISSLFVNREGSLQRLSEMMYWNGVKMREITTANFKGLLERARGEYAGANVIEAVFYELMKKRDTTSKRTTDTLEEMQKHLKEAHPQLNEDARRLLADGLLRRGIKPDLSLKHFLTEQFNGASGKIGEQEIKDVLEMFGPEINAGSNGDDGKRKVNRERETACREANNRGAVKIRRTFGRRR